MTRHDYIVTLLTRMYEDACFRIDWFSEQVTLCGMGAGSLDDQDYFRSQRNKAVKEAAKLESRLFTHGVIVSEYY